MLFKWQAFGRFWLSIGIFLQLKSQKHTKSIYKTDLYHMQI